MNVLKKISDKDYKIGDIVIVTSVDKNHNAYRSYPITIGKRFKVVGFEKKPYGRYSSCSSSTLNNCDKVCKDKCINIEQVDNPLCRIWSCYVHFVKE